MEYSICKPESGGGLARNPCHKAMFGFFDHTADVLESLAFQGKLPKLAIVVEIQEVFSHCPKAFMRSKLWAVESQIDRRELPSFAEILRDHAALGECDLDELPRELDHRAESMLHELEGFDVASEEVEP